jgi:thiol-disulfide isomerase/thioredoxin
MKLSKKLSLPKMNTENVLIAVLLVVLIVLVVMFVKQNRETFTGKKVVVYFFFVDWCPHCTTAKPEVAKLANEVKKNNGKLNGVEVVVKQVNAEKNAELAKANNVSAYPTVILEKANGDKVELNKSCTYDNIAELVNNNA